MKRYWLTAAVIMLAAAALTAAATAFYKPPKQTRVEWEVARAANNMEVKVSSPAQGILAFEVSKQHTNIHRDAAYWFTISLDRVGGPAGYTHGVWTHTYDDLPHLIGGKRNKPQKIELPLEQVPFPVAAGRYVVYAELHQDAAVVNQLGELIQNSMRVAGASSKPIDIE